LRTPYGHEVYAMAAEYPSAASLYEAAKMVRDAGFKRWDVHSPFPIHGMDEAMGLGKSWLSGWVLFGGVSGLLTAAIVEFGPSWGLYRLVVHGKPYDWRTVPAFFPIMFEMTVLFGALSTILGIVFNALFAARRLGTVAYDGRFTNDKFGIFVPSEPARAPQVESLLRGAGAEEVRRA